MKTVRNWVNDRNIFIFQWFVTENAQIENILSIKYLLKQRQQQHQFKNSWTKFIFWNNSNNKQQMLSVNIQSINKDLSKRLAAQKPNKSDFINLVLYLCHALICVICCNKRKYDTKCVQKEGENEREKKYCVEVLT